MDKISPFRFCLSHTMAQQLFFKTYNEVEAGKPNGIPRYLTAELSWMLLELNKFWKNA